MYSEADAVAIEVAGVGKIYRLHERPWQRLVQSLPIVRNWRLAGVHRHFRALDDVTFRIGRGEVVGILGRNGSGKSTLLQIIAGTLRASTGTARVNGRVAALLELGAGFNPDFTGMENLRLNAAILGLSADEVERRIPQILDFADIGDFVHQPVKTYSSGMYVRLAFAVAACVDPDVLIVDEALAVGDVKFQSRCFRRFEELVRKGTTVLLVTHSTEQVVRHCKRALLLDDGRLIDDGEPREVANRYLDLMLGGDAAANAEPAPVAGGEAADSALEARAGYCNTEYRWGEGGAELYDASLASAYAPGHRVRFEAGDKVMLSVRARFSRQVGEPIFGFFVKTPDGVTVYGSNSLVLLRERSSAFAGDEQAVCFEFNAHLGMGSYLLSLGIAERANGEIIPLDRRYDVLQFEIVSRSGAVGLADLHAQCRVLEQRDDGQM